MPIEMLSPILADLSAVPADFLKHAVVLLVGAAGGALAVKQLFKGDKADRREVSPQPLRVQEEPPYVTRDQCVVATGTIAERISRQEHATAEMRKTSTGYWRSTGSEMRVDRDRLSSMLLKEIGGVHTRINQILEAVAKLRGAFRSAETTEDAIHDGRHPATGAHFPTLGAAGPEPMPDITLGVARGCVPRDDASREGAGDSQGGGQGMDQRCA